MSDLEDFSEDIEADEPVSTDGSDTEGSLKYFIASEDEEGDSPSTDEDSSDEIQPELILTGKRKRTVRVSDSPEISTDSDDPDYEPGDCV
jgi:hypothetical protein